MMYFTNFLGSSLSLPAHPSSRTLRVHYGAGGWVGARATSLLAVHFALQNTASNSAEKKGSPSEQTLSPENLKCLDWSQLLNEARTFFERKSLE